MSCIKCLCIKSFAENVVGTRMNGCIRTQNLTFYVKHKKKKKKSKASGAGLCRVGAGSASSVAAILQHVENITLAE